ncbi:MULTISPECIES: alpha/beta fold hydrolase [Trichocoleus]|uniref:Alpha/beta hydrolase n=1 Tax=Trichocoleus desertorum GB2-A4 TaxID=2933944 RepID=A0ABV0JBV0_9CYAN|nr:MULTISPECIES: alpha/beta hydrolase [unclassified Trichocoleus]MBD1865387.1 alpha/beta hydrolase [Trichocoleus sp. FACHB-46]MBD2120951.1 alpha/beta hydrolase [Trichocoleus sp. FACHB-262]
MTQNIFLRNNITVFGEGTQPLLFAPGFGCDQNVWRFVTSAFKDDYKIVLFDYVGSGKSDLQAYNVERYSDLKGYAQDVLDVCTALDLKDVIFVGHSVSGVIGMLASIQAPQLFSHLILVAPSPCYINDLPDYQGGFDRQDIEELLDLMDKNYIGWASFLAPVIMQNSAQPELTQELETSFCSTDPVIMRRFAEVTFFSDNRSDLPQVTVPSLILQCSEDAIAPTEIGHYLHRHLSESTLQMMQATGHCPHMSHPEEIIQLIQTYLTETPAS